MALFYYSNFIKKILCFNVLFIAIYSLFYYLYSKFNLLTLFNNGGVLFIFSFIASIILSYSRYKIYYSYFKLKNEIQSSNKNLIDSESLFKMVADFSNAWEMFRDPNNKVLYCSPSIERILGYTPEEYIQLPISAVIYPDDYELAGTAHYRLCQKGEYVDPVTFRLVKKNGDIIWVEVFGQPVYSKDGKHIASRTSTHDISKLKNTELALRESEARLKLISDYSNNWEVLGTKIMLLFIAAPLSKNS